MSALWSRLRRVYVSALRLEREDQVPETGIVKALHIDSIGVLEVLMHVEDEFKIVIDDADLGPTLVDSLHLLCDYVTARTKSTLSAS